MRRREQETIEEQEEREEEVEEDIFIRAGNRPPSLSPSPSAHPLSLLSTLFKFLPLNPPSLTFN